MKLIDEGWIEWNGGECPVPVGTRVDVKHRDGDEGFNRPAGQLSDGVGTGRAIAYDWTHDNSGGDIISYRLHQSKQDAPVWNGEGLPPVGVECEWLASGDHDWLAVTVLVYDGKDACLKPSDGTQSFVVGNVEGFRPIRSEAERKRQEAIDAIAELCRSSASNGHSSEMIYAAIAAGNIPGVKLEVTP